jgi:hypothetical protein
MDRGETLMPTRFYWPSSGSAPLASLAFGATGNTWTKTTSAVRLPMSTTKAGTLTSSLSIAGNGVDPSNVCACQLQSPALAAQTISGTVLGINRVSEASNTDNYFAQLLIKAVSNDGTTERGVLLAFNNAALTQEWPVGGSQAATRGFPREAFPLDGEALTSLAIQDGDRLIIEPGFRQESTSTGNGTLRIGDDNATDYGVAASETDVKNPWIEFSGTITFQGAGAEGAVGDTLRTSMNRLAGTSGLDAQGAANIYAGTIGMDLVGALNTKAGNARSEWKELAGVLNQLAGTTGLDVNEAARRIVG